MAQSGPLNTPSRAFDRLFAPEQTGPANLTVSVMGGHDSQSGNAAEAQTSPIPLGTFFGVNPTVSVGSGNFSVDGGAVVRRYTDGGNFGLYEAHSGYSVRLASRRVTARVSGVVSYAPFSQFLGVQGLQATGGLPDRAGYDRPVTTLGSSLSVGRQLGRRLMLSGSYTFQYRHLGPATDPTDTFGNTQTHDIGARLSRQVGRNTIVFGGYGTRFTTEQAQGTRPLRAHDIDIGVDRSQQLKFSRRTTLQFSTGSSIVGAQVGYRFFAIGSVTLRHAMSQTWTAAASARRGVAYLEGIPEPALSDSVSLSFGGGIGPRLDLQLDGGYSNGAIGLSAASSGFRLYSGTARVRGILTRRLAAYAEWVIYDQHFDSRPDLPALFEPTLRRQGLRIGVMVNVPIQSEPSRQRGAR